MLEHLRISFLSLVRAAKQQEQQQQQQQGHSKTPHNKDPHVSGLLNKDERTQI